MSASLEYRVLWVELIAGWPVPFRGRVYSYAEASQEAANRRKSANCRNVLIEAREQSGDDWPNPLDPTEMWMAKAKGAKA